MGEFQCDERRLEGMKRTAERGANITITVRVIGLFARMISLGALAHCCLTFEKLFYVEDDDPWQLWRHEKL